MKYVYVINESGSWDYEETGKVEVYETFEKALTRFNELVETAKKDLKEWCGENLIESEEINKEKEYANYEGYLDGDSTNTHDYISILKEEVK